MPRLDCPVCPRRQWLVWASLSALWPLPSTAQGRAPASAAAPTQERVRVLPWLRGDTLAAVPLQTAAGAPWSPTQHRGRVLLINAWATWCEPCVEELPSLQALADAHVGRLDVVALHHANGAAGAAAFTERMGLRLPLVQDTQGEAMRRWALRVLPTTVVIDSHGTPRWRVVGALDWQGPAAQRLLAPWLATSLVR